MTDSFVVCPFVTYEFFSLTQYKSSEYFGKDIINVDS